MILGFIGKQRNGKTLMMTKIAKYYQSQGFTIVTNQRKLGFPHIYFDPAYLESKEGIEELKKKMKTNKLIFCLDEAHLWVDSRRSKHNTAKSFFITQAGKLMEEQGHFMYTTQFFGQVDIRLRYNTTFIFEVSKHSDTEGIDYFKIRTYEPRGDKAFPIKETVISSKEVYENDLYDRFEMIDVED